MTKEERAEYNKQYRLKNKEKLREYDKNRYRDDPDRKIQGYNSYHKNKDVTRKKYIEENKEKIKEYQSHQRQTPQGMKTNRIGKWKHRGVICDDWDAFYERFIKATNCENCNCILSEDRIRTPSTKCLDHDHSIADRENIREIICHSCNVSRG